MALLWCDGFDHYGEDETNMTNGVYASMGQALSTTHPATGTHGVFVDKINGSINVDNAMRKVLPSAVTKMGVAGRFWYDSLPSVSTGSVIFAFHSGTANNVHLTVYVDSNGALRFYRGNTYGFPAPSLGTLVATTNPIITANAQHHIEIQVNISSTVGWIRVAVNGVHQFQQTGLNTQYDGSGIASVSQMLESGVSSRQYYIDDLIYYDFTGNPAVDTDFAPTVDGSGVGTNYIAELECWYLPPNGDTAEADFLKSTGTSGFALIDETDPNDADYIYSTTAGDLSEFDLTDLPVQITYIRGLQLLGRLSKNDSGAAQTQFGMNSAGTTNDAAARAITTAPTYWWDFMNVDPHSSGRWTRPSLNAAKIRITRSV